MKSARKPKRSATIPFPRPVPVSSIPPAPLPDPPSPFRRPHEWPTESVLVRNERSLEERVLDPTRWPRYGLELIPVSTEPFRLTVRGVLRKIPGAAVDFWHDILRVLP